MLTRRRKATIVLGATLMVCFGLFVTGVTGRDGGSMSGWRQQNPSSNDSIEGTPPRDGKSSLIDDYLGQLLGSEGHDALIPPFDFRTPTVPLYGLHSYWAATDHGSAVPTSSNYSFMDAIIASERRSADKKQTASLAFISQQNQHTNIWPMMEEDGQPLSIFGWIASQVQTLHRFVWEIFFPHTTSGIPFSKPDQTYFGGHPGIKERSATRNALLDQLSSLASSQWTNELQTLTTDLVASATAYGHLLHSAGHTIPKGVRSPPFEDEMMIGQTSSYYGSHRCFLPAIVAEPTDSQVPIEGHRLRAEALTALRKERIHSSISAAFASVVIDIRVPAALLSNQTSTVVATIFMINAVIAQYKALLADLPSHSMFQKEGHGKQPPLIMLRIIGGGEVEREVRAILSKRFVSHKPWIEFADNEGKSTANTLFLASRPFSLIRVENIVYACNHPQALGGSGSTFLAVKIPFSLTSWRSSATPDDLSSVLDLLGQGYFDTTAIRVASCLTNWTAARVGGVAAPPPTRHLPWDHFLVGASTAVDFETKGVAPFNFQQTTVVGNYSGIVLNSAISAKQQGAIHAVAKIIPSSGPLYGGLPRQDAVPQHQHNVAPSLWPKVGESESFDGVDGSAARSTIVLRRGFLHQGALVLTVPDAVILAELALVLGTRTKEQSGHGDTEPTPTPQLTTVADLSKRIARQVHFPAADLFVAQRHAVDDLGLLRDSELAISTAMADTLAAVWTLRTDSVLVNSSQQSNNEVHHAYIEDNRYDFNGAVPKTNRLMRMKTAATVDPQRISDARWLFTPSEVSTKSLLPNSSLHRMHYGLTKQLYPSPPVTTVLGLKRSKVKHVEQLATSAEALVDKFLHICKRPPSSKGDYELGGTMDAEVDVSKDLTSGGDTMLSYYLVQLHSDYLGPRSRLEDLQAIVALKLGVNREKISNRTLPPARHRTSLTLKDALVQSLVMASVPNDWHRLLDNYNWPLAEYLTGFYHSSGHVGLEIGGANNRAANYASPLFEGTNYIEDREVEWSATDSTASVPVRDGDVDYDADELQEHPEKVPSVSGFEVCANHGITRAASHVGVFLHYPDSIPSKPSQRPTTVRRYQELVQMLGSNESEAQYVPVEKVKDKKAYQKALKTVTFVLRRIQSHIAMPIRDAIDIFLHTNAETEYLKDLLAAALKAEAGTFTARATKNAASNPLHSSEDGLGVPSLGSQDLQQLYNHRGDTLDRYDHEEYPLMPIVRLADAVTGATQSPTKTNGKPPPRASDGSPRQIHVVPFLPSRIRIFVVEHRITELRGDYLPWKARVLMKELIGLYDLQIFCEDDIRVNPRTIALYCQWNNKLRSRGYFLTFTRPEFHPEKKSKVLISRPKPIKQHFVTMETGSLAGGPDRFKASVIEDTEASVRIVTAARIKSGRKGHTRVSATITTYSVVSQDGLQQLKDPRSPLPPPLTFSKTFAYTDFDGAYAGFWASDTYDMQHMYKHNGYLMDDADFRQNMILEHASCDNGNRMLAKVYPNGWVFPLRGLAPHLSHSGASTSPSQPSPGISNPYGYKKGQLPYIVKTTRSCEFEVSSDLKRESNWTTLALDHCQKGAADASFTIVGQLGLHTSLAASPTRKRLVPKGFGDLADGYSALLRLKEVEKLMTSAQKGLRNPSSEDVDVDVDVAAALERQFDNVREEGLVRKYTEALAAAKGATIHHLLRSELFSLVISGIHPDELSMKRLLDIRTRRPDALIDDFFYVSVIGAPPFLKQRGAKGDGRGTASRIRRAVHRHGLATRMLLLHNEGPASPHNCWRTGWIDKEIPNPKFVKSAAPEMFATKMSRWYVADNSVANVYKASETDMHPNQRQVPDHHYAYYNGDLNQGWSDTRTMVHHMANKYIHLEEFYSDTDVNTFEIAGERPVSWPILHN